VSWSGPVRDPIVLRSGRSRATVHPELGGRLGQLDLGDGSLLRGPAPGLGWAEWGCYPLLPWSNRIPEGRLTVGSVEWQLPVNWPDGSAIHGLVASSPWTVAAATDRDVQLVTDATAGPYEVRGKQAYELGSDGLELTVTLVNHADHAVPAGLGIHPWFRAGRVRVPADEKWPGEPVPVAPPVPVEPEEDLRAGAVPPPMDRSFTALTGREVEVPGLALRWDGPVTQVVVYSGEPGWVAVEPVTMAPDGFGLAARGVDGNGVQVLESGDELSVAYRFVRLGPPESS
jgi:aldose 1-epimerase